MTTPLEAMFERVRAEKRSALIAYIPAGFPTIADCHRVIDAFIAGGVDAIETVSYTHLTLPTKRIV